MTRPSDPDVPASGAGRAPTTRGFQRLAAAAAVTALVVIAVGGAVRATDSGLACPTWPGCFSGGDFLPPADLNVWLEHSHRLLAGVLGLQIAGLMLWVLRRYRHVPSILWPTVAAAVAVNIQAVLGALVVWNLLQAEIVTTHLGLGTGVMVLMLYLAVRSRHDLRRPRPGPAASLFNLAVGVTVVTWLQILVGGHLTGVGGGLAFVEDPALGVFSLGPAGSDAELTNVLHRVGSIVVAGAVMVLAARLRRADGIEARAVTFARVSVYLVILQIGIGVANLASSLSFLSVIPHLAVASWILACLALCVLSLARADRPADVPQRTTDVRDAMVVGA